MIRPGGRAGVVVAIVFAAWLGRLLHEARPHVYCERHQTFEESVEGPTPESAEGPALEAAAPGAGAHDECPLAGQHQNLSREAPVHAVAHVVPAAIALAVDQSSRPPIAILANAPKASPPSVS